ncbi:MAG: MauE/DoxX family redox-associated membrane protein [Pseudomonadota bacterium]
MTRGDANRALQITTSVAWLLRVGLGGLLIVAGALKLADPSTFATEIANYQLIPAAAPYLAAALPVTELLVGAGLMLLPLAWRRSAALATLALLALFSIAVTSAYARGIDISCGCFGGGGSAITALTLLRNAGLVAAAALLLLVDRRLDRQHQHQHQHQHPQD